MKTITKTFKAYEHHELSPKAFRKAYDAWNEDNDMPWLQSMMNDECNELTRAAGMKCTSNHPVCLYSLSSSQGDGAMFEGTFLWKEYSVKIKHAGRYYHSNSKTIDIYKIVDGQEIEACKEDADEFEELYQGICKKIEKFGYDCIEDETSEAHFVDECRANDWIFTEDGTLISRD